MLDQAFDSLKSYDWGADRNLLNPIEEAVIATHDDPSARQELESRLAGVLQSDVSRDAKDYVCRKLMLIGSSASTPALAALLLEADHSHMARFALERIPAPEAAQALRDALPRLAGVLKIGVIGSLGARRDAASVPALAALIADADAAIAKAAADALGDIRTSEAVQALMAARPAHAEATVAAVDAQLASAEQLLADGKKAEAIAVYKSLAGARQPKHVRLAATSGLLESAGKGTAP